jgi:hypothetical protein
VGMISTFMDLPEVLHGWDIKFTIQKRTSSVLSVLLDEVYGIARKIMWSNYEEELQFKSLVEIGAFLWQQQLPVRRAAPRQEEIVPQTAHKRRKTSGELSSRQLSNCGKVILNMVSNSICVNNEDTVPYLVAAIHESRTLSSLDSVSKSIFGNSNEINEIFMTNIVKDIRIIKCVSEIPNKYITFSDEEKNQVLRIYDVVLQVFESQLPDALEGVDVSVASVTQMVLKDMTGYSELIENTIERWSKNRALIKEKTGRKVDKDFECAIWGQLMICEYENIKVFALSYLFLIWKRISTSFILFYFVLFCFVLFCFVLFCFCLFFPSFTVCLFLNFLTLLIRLMAKTSLFPALS